MDKFNILLYCMHTRVWERDYEVLCTLFQSSYSLLVALTVVGLTLTSFSRHSCLMYVILQKRTIHPQMQLNSDINIIVLQC